MQLAQQEPNAMLDYEKKYRNTQGQNTEHELAKIMLRYQNEGRPEQYYSGSESRKQVRFEEHQSAFYQGEGQEISHVEDARI